MSVSTNGVDVARLEALLSREIAKNEDLRKQRDELLTGVHLFERAAKEYVATKELPAQVKVSGDLSQLSSLLYRLMQRDAEHMRSIEGSPNQFLDRAREQKQLYGGVADKKVASNHLYDALECLRSAYRETEVPFYKWPFVSVDRVLRANILVEFADINSTLQREWESAAYAIEALKYVSSGHPAARRAAEILFDFGKDSRKTTRSFSRLYLARAHEAFPTGGYNIGFLCPDPIAKEPDEAYKDLLELLYKKHGKGWLLTA